MDRDQCAADEFNRLRNILSSWDEYAEAQSRTTLDAFVQRLIAHGWTRREVYDLLQRTCSVEFARFPQAGLEYVADVETAVTGHVAPAAIMRFPDDPVGDVEQLAQYVRFGAWRESGRCALRDPDPGE